MMRNPYELLERAMQNMRSTRGDIRFYVVIAIFDIDLNEAIEICEVFGHDPFAALPPFDDNAAPDRTADKAVRSRELLSNAGRRNHET